MMHKYVLFTNDRGHEIYWTGQFTESGRPSYSQDVYDARFFDSAREAYGTGEDEGMDWWKVGKRDIQYYQ